MTPFTILFMTCVLISGVLLSGPMAVVADALPTGRAISRPVGSAQSSDTPVWTAWGANQYALADDGTFVWIGGTGGIVRWNKQQLSYHRYSTVDGLPHTTVFAVAVDGSGNRWFGGDGGLSRLDAEQHWTHFRAANSGLYSDQVAAIAVVGDTLYVSHGLPGGSASRMDGDGAWRWFPNRETTIEADYATIVQKRGSTALWTVAGNEIWAGSRVFDGERWHERKLPDSLEEPVSLAVDSRNHVWALSSGWTVYEWDGAGWLPHPVDLGFSGKITTLAVDEDDRVWIGLQDRGKIFPAHYETAGVKELAGTQGGSLGVSGPVAALLSTPEGLWAVGPGWLMSPNFTVTKLTDGPLFQDVTDASLGGDGLIWLYSSSQQSAGAGAVQVLDDRGTLAREDDAWQVRPTDLPNWGGCESVTAFERAADDTWYASYCDIGFWWDDKAVRYRGGERIEYPLTNQQVDDIFAQDQHHIWFTSWDHEVGNVLSLDDSGTPADTSDDVWRTFPIGAADGKLVVAVDALSRIWLGQASGLYRYDGSAWQLIYGEHPVCDLTPAVDGTLYAQVLPYGVTACEGHSDNVLVVRADGTIEDPTSSKWLIRDAPDIVRTARWRNSLWTIASDGAIWYISHLDPGQELQRRSSSGLDTYALPVEPETVKRLEVDARGHVWLVADSQLWRMEGPRPVALPVQQYLPMIRR